MFMQYYTQQPKPGNNPNVHQTVDKKNMILHEVDYYSTIKRNEILFMLKHSWTSKKQGTKGHILYISINMKGPE
jgi:hypothetical protein